MRDTNTTSYRQLAYCKGLGLNLSTPKTPMSVRTILVGQTVLDLLARWKVSQGEKLKALGTGYVHAYAVGENQQIVQKTSSIADSGEAPISFVCKHLDGRLVSRMSVGALLWKIGLNAHSFRQTYATRGVEAGVTPKAMAAQLGHCTAEISQNLYAHATEKMQEDAAKILEAALAD